MFRQHIACHHQGALVVLAKITIKHAHAPGVILSESSKCTVQQLKKFTVHLLVSFISNLRDARSYNPKAYWLLSKVKTRNTIALDVFFTLCCYAESNINILLVLATEFKPIAPDCNAVDGRRRKFVAGPSVIV